MTKSTKEIQSRFGLAITARTLYQARRAPLGSGAVVAGINSYSLSGRAQRQGAPYHQQLGFRVRVDMRTNQCDHQYGQTSRRVVYTVRDTGEPAQEWTGLSAPPPRHNTTRSKTCETSPWFLRSVAGARART